MLLAPVGPVSRRCEETIVHVRGQETIVHASGRETIVHASGRETIVHHASGRELAVICNANGSVST